MDESCSSTVAFGQVNALTSLGDLPCGNWPVGHDTHFEVWQLGACALSMQHVSNDANKGNVFLILISYFQLR